MRVRQRGFTLIELMIVVAILAILSAIAIPMYGSLLGKAEEGTTKGNLATLRAALGIYFSDNDGTYPPYSATMDALTNGAKYLANVPRAYLPATPYGPGHPASNFVHGGAFFGGTIIAAGAVTVNLETVLGNGGGWMYAFEFDGASGAGVAYFMTNCGHKDERGASWTSY